MVLRVLREPCSAEPLPMVPASGFEHNLAMVGDCCRVLLNHLGRAAKLANNATTRCAQGGRDAAVEALFEDYFNLLDPVGVEERIQYNRRVEEDAIGLEINYMGYLLVTDVEDFHRRMEKEPSDVSAELVAIAGTLHSCPVPLQASHVLSRAKYETAYLLNAEIAFAWQDLLDDEGFLNVWRLLREYVIDIECFLYLE